MAKNIQDLRREAGYSSAKDFAAALNIPQSTYARYENQPDGIPLKQAWAIADFLGCSIDMVVGREPVNVEDMRGDIQKFYDGLLPENRELLDDYLRYIRDRERRAEQRKRMQERHRYLNMARLYERMFTQTLYDSPEPDALVVFDTQKGYVSAFREFLLKKVEERRWASCRKWAKEEIVRMKENGEYKEPIEDIEIPIGEEGYDEALEEYLTAVSVDYETAHEGKVEEVVEKILEAYLRANPESRRWGGTSYAVVEYDPNSH